MHGSSGELLARDHEHAEHGDRELRHVHAGERDVERVTVGALVQIMAPNGTT